MVSVHGILFAIMLLHLQHTVVATANTSVTSSNELEKELRQIRTELCASYIDRNNTASALIQFQKITGKEPIKDLVKLYIDFYQDNLDNLLQFLSNLKSDVQQISYQTIFLICMKQINVMFFLF